jgi:hypothetical protein
LKNAFVVAAGTLLLVVTAACTTGVRRPDADSSPASENRQLQPPCLGTADGDCPSGNPLQDF